MVIASTAMMVMVMIITIIIITILLMFLLIVFGVARPDTNHSVVPCLAGCDSCYDDRDNNGDFDGGHDNDVCEGCCASLCLCCLSLLVTG